MRTIHDVISEDGYLGLVEKCLFQLKKLFWTRVYQIRFRKVGRGTKFEGAIVVRGSKRIEFGENCVIQEGVAFHCGSAGSIVVENNCFFARGAVVSCDGSARFHEGVSVQRRVEMSVTKGISVGAKSWIASDTKISGTNILIGEAVILGPNVFIVTGDHDYDESSNRCLMSSKGNDIPITIERGCWVGAKAILLKGVSIGEGSIVGAGSVVTKAIPGKSIALGVPATIFDKQESKS